MTSMVIFGELFVGDFGYKFKFNHQTLVIQKNNHGLVNIIFGAPLFVVSLDRVPSP